jgi:tetratricopeptide (TPR) repeat protein
MYNQAQIIDTLVDVGNHKLHFNIKKGNGIPILFEAGSGNDATIWKSLLEPIYSITGTTLITYDRPGYGKSELNLSLPDDKKGLITYGIQDLEKGLEKLGYNSGFILVAHSYGGFYSAMFASRNQKKVKGIVLIDVSHISYVNAVLHKYRFRNTKSYLENLKNLHLGVYYETLAYEETVRIMNDIDFPFAIPIIDIVAENPPNSFKDINDQKKWTSSHKQFVDEELNRIGITAFNCGHYIFFQNPSLVINAIIKSYADANVQIDHEGMLKESLNYNIEVGNNNRKKEFKYWHSEREINIWGYSFLNNNEITKAIEIFKLNIELFPTSANVYDSLGEAYLKNGDEKSAIKNYKKSLELNPDNTNAITVLKELRNE